VEDTITIDEIIEILVTLEIMLPEIAATTVTTDETEEEIDMMTEIDTEIDIKAITYSVLALYFVSDFYDS